MGLIYQDKTEILRRCFFDVQNEVGLGRQEEAYHAACKLWLSEHQVPFASKLPHLLLFQGQMAHTLHPDLVAWDSITIELKSVSRALRKTEFVQLFDYLKLRNDRLGLLVNLGLGRAQVERVVYERQATTLTEDWSYWSGKISGRAREIGIVVRDTLRAIYHEHQTGYGEEVVEKLIQCCPANQSIELHCQSDHHGVLPRRRGPPIAVRVSRDRKLHPAYFHRPIRRQRLQRPARQVLSEGARPQLGYRGEFRQAASRIHWPCETYYHGAIDE